ncbi:hypothetical protein BDF22DRAFT_312119 [Syncephalis plumigaleata]|nr:hypothetical protein BDF22DRAFT_312119 [Syncephalis plumigaleata]
MKLSSAITFTIVVASVVGGIMAAATPPKQRVEPGEVKLSCLTLFFGGCPDCPDGYHWIRGDSPHKFCAPDKDAPYYMAKCVAFGKKCDACPDGWKQADKEKYIRHKSQNYLKYCVRDESN